MNWTKTWTDVNKKGIYIDAEDQKSGPSRRRMRMRWNGNRNCNKNWTFLDGTWAYINCEDHKSGHSKWRIEMRWREGKYNWKKNWTASMRRGHA